MKVSVITTVKHNIGDDFVREGIIYLLKKKYSNRKLNFQYIHKHSPITARMGIEWFRLNKWGVANKIDKLLPLFLTRDRVLDCDLLIQSGAPVFWCHEIGGGHCWHNEWYNPLIRDRFLKRHDGAKFFNIAAGTCQRYHSDGSEFCNECNAYIENLYNLADVTTVRDTLSKTVLSKLAIEVPVIPCTSIFAIDEHKLKPEDESYVAINYMSGGAHYTFGQDINSERWENEFRKFYFELKKKEKIIFVCHNQKESNEAKRIDPEAEIFYQKDDYLSYMKFYAKAKCGIMNRVHGAFMIASYGRPSIIIGNDSRAKMASEIGLESFFVNDVTAELLMEKYDLLLSEKDHFGEKFFSLKKQAYLDYLEVLTV